MAALVRQWEHQSSLTLVFGTLQIGFPCTPAFQEEKTMVSIWLKRDTLRTFCLFALVNLLLKYGGLAKTRRKLRRFPKANHTTAEGYNSLVFVYYSRGENGQSYK